MNEEGMTPDGGMQEGALDDGGAAQNGGADTPAQAPVENTLLNTGGEVTPAGVPAEYAAFTLPEGIDAENTAVKEAVSEASGLFREMGLSQAQAQRLIDLHMKHYVGGMAENNEMFEEEVNRRVKQWGEQTKADPEYGGAKLAESVQSVRRAIAHLGGAKLEEALTRETGIINHPVVFRAFAKMGKMFAEDSFIRGGGGEGSGVSPQSIAARVYPDMQKKF